MRDLAAAVGVAPGAFYRHYASKEALLHELTGPLADGLVTLATELSRRAGTADEATDEETIRRYTDLLFEMRTLVRFATTDPAYWRHPALGQRARVAAEEVAALLARRNGGFLARCALGAILGGVTAAATGDDDVTAEGIADVALRVLAGSPASASGPGRPSTA
jgi:AcrR family transcriptional regulator